MGDKEGSLFNGVLMNHYRRSFDFFVLCLALLIPFTFDGCSKPAEAKPTIAIQKTNPSGETPLLAGQSVHFEVAVVAYNATKPASVTIIVQAADGTLLCNTPPENLAADQTRTLSVDVQIPRSTSVTVYAALYDDPTKNSVAVDSRMYKVAGVLAQ